MTPQHPPNRLERQLERLDEVPVFARTWFRSVVLRRAVPFTATAGIRFIEMSQTRTEVSIANKHKVHNHQEAVHASAMHLLAETATGMLVGMNLRDDCLPLAKEMKMAFKHPASGALRAVATLTAAQIALMQASVQGEVQVAVTLTDEAGIQPVECEFVWAWMASGPQKAKATTE